MPVARLPAALTLCVALLLGAVPWSVCAHGAEGHARLVLAGAAHGHANDPHDGQAAPHACPHGHGHGCGAPHGGPDGSCPEESAPEGDPHCHCDDGRLQAGSLLAAVALAPPTFAGLLPRLLPPSPPRPGAPEVAPTRAVGRGRAHEEDPIVLLR